MGSGIFYPVVNGDDAYWNDVIGAGAIWDATSNYMFFGGGLSTYSYRSGIRFQNVTIPARSSIISATLKVYCYSGSSGTVNANIYFNAIGNAVAPTNQAAALALSSTSAAANWTFSDTWVGSTQYTSPSIVSPLQEVVNNSGYASGNAVMALIIAANTTNNPRSIYSVVGDGGTKKPELHVEWGPAPAAVDDVATWNPDDSGSNLTFSGDLLTATHA